MSYQEHDVNGVLRIWADDEDRLVHTYDDAGIEIGEPRDYSPEENAVADANAARETAEASADALRTAVRSIITEVKAERDTLDAEFLDSSTGQQASNSVINNSPARYIKAVKKFDERVSRALIDVAKLLTE